MRIRRLDLVRFGKFTDRRIDLPPGAPDLHLIIGQNEAGKSTLRAALADLLFGMEPRSAFNFLHAYADLCIAAVIEAGSERLSFQRLKRNRDSLRDAEDRPLPDERLSAFLGPVDRGFFERMFALDRRRLEAGGVEILAAKNDLGRMLFEASAGIAGLGDLRRGLDAEADALWAPRRSQTRAFYQAQAKFEEAAKGLRETTVRAGDWQKAHRSAEEAAQTLAAAVDRHRASEAVRVRLDRVRRVAPHLQRRDERLAVRALLGEVARLPADAAARLAEVEKSLATQAAEIARQQALLERAEAEQARVSVDEAVLARHDAIGRLGEERSRVRDHPADIAKRLAEVQRLRDQAAGLVRQLGWPAADDAAIAALIPSRLVRAGIRDLLQRHAGLAEAARLSADAVTSAERELQALDRDLAILPDRPVSSALLAARGRARRLGDVESSQQELRQAVAVAGRRLANAVADLAPWAAEVEELRTLSLPAPDVAQDLAARLHQLDEQRRLVRAQAEETAHALDTARLAETQVRRDRRPPTAADIDDARADRDATWAAIRDGRASLATMADGFQGKVVHADALADRRYLAAADVEKLEQIRAHIEQLELKIDRHRTDREALDAELERHNAAWVQALPAALATLAPAAYVGWRDRRRHALDAADALATAEPALARLDDEVAAASAGLREALTDSDAAPSLTALLAEADARIANAEAEAARRGELLRQRTRLADSLHALCAKAERAVAELAQWQSRWHEGLATAHLPASTTPAAADAALDLQADLQQTLDQIDELLRARIATMQRDLEVHATAASTLAAELAPNLVEEEAGAITLALIHRLEEAKTAQERLKQAAADRAEAMKAIAAAHAVQQAGEARLRPLMDLAGALSVDDLRVAVDRSAQANEIDAATADATARIIELGDGLGLAELAAEVAAEDLSTIAARVDEVAAATDAAQADRERCILTKKVADDALAAIDGSAAAAEAEALRQEALADMTMAVERYVTVFVAGKVLGWAIDRFRAEKQDPLLRRAGEIFRGLTRGSFAALTVDYDGDTPHLMGRRDDRSHVPVEGMSEGTRDQLYLALRLAAIELHLDKGRPLPFIADDLFVNFDDERAAAGFRALADLARRTQVIFLSHHAHLVDVAKGALGEGVIVTEL